MAVDDHEKRRPVLLCGINSRDMISNLLKWTLKNFRLVPALITICLVVAAYTYWLPIIRVVVSPLGSKAWSVRDIVKVIPKGVFQPAKKPSFKIDFDFVDLVMKILPKNSQTQAPKKLSLTFIYCMLVPVALVIAYLGVFLQFVMIFFSKGQVLQKTAGVTIVASLYALIGTYYLGVQAQIAFTNAVERASQGTFGFVAKYLVQQTAVCAGAGAYTLLVATTLVFLTSFFWRRR